MAIPALAVVPLCAGVRSKRLGICVSVIRRSPVRRGEKAKEAGLLVTVRVVPLCAGVRKDTHRQLRLVTSRSPVRRGEKLALLVLPAALPSFPCAQG